MPISSPNCSIGVPGSVNSRLNASSSSAAIVVEHRRETAPDAAIVKLHLFFRTERLEHALALRVRQAAEIELIMAAEEVHPLRRRRPP